MFDRIRNLIFKRRQAYRALFTPGGQLSPAAMIVLTDLRKFCRATVSTATVAQSGQIDSHASMLAEGRREVWLRICQHIHIDDADLYRLVEKETGTE